MSHVESLVHACLARNLTVTFSARGIDIETPLNSNVRVRSAGGSHDGSDESLDGLCKALVDLVSVRMTGAGDDRKPEWVE